MANSTHENYELERDLRRQMIEEDIKSFNHFIIVLIICFVAVMGLFYAGYRDHKSQTASIEEATAAFKTQYGVEIIDSYDTFTQVPMEEEMAYEMILRKGTSLQNCLVVLESESSYLVTCEANGVNTTLNPVSDKI